jgi:hypothetical protein
VLIKLGPKQLLFKRFLQSSASQLSITSCHINKSSHTDDSYKFTVLCLCLYNKEGNIKNKVMYFSPWVMISHHGRAVEWVCWNLTVGTTTVCCFLIFTLVFCVDLHVPGILSRIPVLFNLPEYINLRYYMYLTDICMMRIFPVRISLRYTKARGVNLVLNVT